MSATKLKPLFTWRTAIAESELPAGARHVALTLSLHMNEIGESAFPSLETLSRETGLHKETVHKHLGVLEAGHYLWVRRGNAGRGGRARVNEYQARLPERSAEPTVTPPRGVDSPNQADQLAKMQVSEVAPAEQRSDGVGSEQQSAEPTVSQTTVGWRENNGRMEPEQRSAEPTGVVDLEDVKLGRTPTPAAAPRPPRARNAAFDALAEECGRDATALTKSAAGEVGTKLAEIRAGLAAENGVEPAEVPWPVLADEIRIRASRYREAHPTWDLTPSSLAKWWDTLVSEPPTTPNGSGPGRLTAGELARRHREAVSG